MYVDVQFHAKSCVGRRQPLCLRVPSQAFVSDHQIIQAYALLILSDLRGIIVIAEFKDALIHNGYTKFAVDTMFIRVFPKCHTACHYQLCTNFRIYNTTTLTSILGRCAIRNIFLGLLVSLLRPQLPAWYLCLPTKHSPVWTSCR